MRILAIILVIIYAQSVNANTIPVCSSCTYRNIQEAIEQAAPEDTVFIQKGIYKTYSLKIDKPITILGEEGTIIDGEFHETILNVYNTECVTISNLEVKNVEVSYTKDYAGIYIKKSNWVTVEHCKFKDTFFGIYYAGSKYGTIHNNKITGDFGEEDSSGNGVHLLNCKMMEVSHNYAKGMRDGIYFEFVDDSFVHNNFSEKNIRYGLHFMFSHRNNYSDNTFQKNGAGVAVMFSKHIIMHRNLFFKNWGTASYGLLLKEINDADIRKNIFLENTIGINSEGSNRIDINSNTFERNGWAVKIRGGCYKNEYLKNNFLNNSFDISSQGRMNDNIFDSNYWSDYVGYDLDRDNIGDVPYRPVKLFSYIVNQTPESIVLLRSFFIDILNFSEKVSPAFTPDNLIDEHPITKIIKW